MKAQQVIAIVALIAMFTISSGHIGGGKLQLQDINPQFFCGKKLSKMLAFLCNDVEKRSDSGSMYNSMLSPYYKEREMQLGWPWSQQKARSQGMAGRGKRLIVSECCDRACSVDELLTYC